MNCPDFDALMMLLDGELEEEKLKEVLEHVKSCSRCRDLIDSQRKLEATWRDSFVTPDSDKFRTMEWNIFKRINRRSRWKTFVPAAAGIIAVLLGVKLILDNKQSLDRFIDLSRGDRAEYTVDSVRFREMRDESLTIFVDELDPEVIMENASSPTSLESDVLTGDVSTEITSEPEDYFKADGELPLPQSAADEEGAGESLRGTSSLAQETDRHSIIGGTVTESASWSSGSGGGSGYVEEYEESEMIDEIISTGSLEDFSLEEQMDDISGITLSLDADTIGLETAETVPSIISSCEDVQDNRASPQTFEYYSRFHETSDNDIDSLKEYICVELVFDANGQPDSSTASLLDSLFTGWSDYISFEYRDTVLVIPLADIQQLFNEGSTVPAETIE